jgi:hypothetical protein
LSNACLPDFSASNAIIIAYNVNGKRIQQSLDSGSRGGDPIIAIDKLNQWLIVVEPKTASRCISLVNSIEFTSDDIPLSNPVGIYINDERRELVVFDRNISVYSYPSLKLIANMNVLLDTSIPASGCGLLADGSVIYGDSSQGTLVRVDVARNIVVSTLQICRSESTNSIGLSPMLND